MSFWKRSIRQVRPVHRDPARSRRAPSRSCRFQLENLEGRALLSTYTISEYLAGSQAHVVVQVNNSPPSDTIVTGSPLPTFVLNTDSLVDTIDIENTSARVPIQVNTANQDTVNVGNAGSVQGILAPVTIDDPPSWNTINIDDSADPTAQTATLSTSTISGLPWGYLAGLAPAGISFKYADTSSVYISTGTGADTVSVAGTGVLTAITGHGYDTVNVGNAGSVQGIQGALSIINPPHFNTININDSDDPAVRTVTLSTFTHTPSWGEVTGLAPAPISYKYEDTSSMNLTTGTGANTVDVQSTGVPTSITDNGLATVNVGDAGSLQGILGFLSINDPSSYNTININDSADTFKTAVLSTSTSGWGNVTGLTPGPISYNYANTSSLHLTTNTWGDTIYVRATGVPTYISTSYTGGDGPYAGTGEGPDTVNIGYEGTVQGIVGALFVSNPYPTGYTAVNIDALGDTGERDVTLSSFWNGPTPGTWGSIAGLAPAAINFAWADMYLDQVNVSAPLGGNISWTVSPDAYESFVGVYVIVGGFEIIN